MDPRGVVIGCPSCGQQNRISFRHLDRGIRCGACKAGIPPVAQTVDVSSTAAFDQLVRESPLPVVVDFWAAWCGPCGMMAPEVEKLAGKHAGRLVVAKVDTEALQGLAARFDVRSIPMMAVFRDGQRIGMDVGAKPVGEIERFVNAVLEKGA